MQIHRRMHQPGFRMRQIESTENKIKIKTKQKKRKKEKRRRKGEGNELKGGYRFQPLLSLEGEGRGGGGEGGLVLHSSLNLSRMI